MEKGVRLNSITRHVLGLFRAVPGARAFRRYLAENATKDGANAQTLRVAVTLIGERTPLAA